MALTLRLAAAAALAAVAIACGSSRGSPAPNDGGYASEAQGEDAGKFGVDAAGAEVDEGGEAVLVDGSYAVGEASIPANRFVTSVVSFTPADCTGFGVASMPGIVEGPPVGGGTDRGSTDVVSLGSGGSIVVSFAPNAIVDGPGPDFVVFENPFDIGGSASNVYAEPGEVSVSDDGVTWQTFPCNPTFDPSASDGTGTAPPYGSCAGWHVVLSTPANGISPLDPSVSGGDAFDLADLGVTHARFVRIVDRTAEACPDAGAERPDDDGFDLDAVAIVNAETP
ncbi:MAG TPA: hypothetical protein VGG39_20085 [Polyangiaceae bacterium]